MQVLLAQDKVMVDVTQGLYVREMFFALPYYFWKIEEEVKTILRM